MQLGELGDGLLGGEVVAGERGLVDVCGQRRCGGRLVGFEIDHVIEGTGRRRVCKGFAGEVREAAHGDCGCGCYCDRMRLRPTVVDDRGTTHDLPLRYVREVPQKVVVRPAATAHPLLTWSAYAAGVLGFAQVLIVIQITRYDPHVPPLLYASASLFCVCMTAALLPGMRYGALPGIAAHVVEHLDESLCPVCKHTLSGLAVEDDGCVVCAECGAAWRVSSG